jgi:hypothetical protein
MLLKQTQVNKKGPGLVAVAQHNFKWLNKSICKANGYSAIYFCHLI